MKNKNEMNEMLDRLCNSESPYALRLEAYEYLMEDCEEFVEDMVERYYTLTDEESAKMLSEVLAEYPGHKGTYMILVSHLFRGDDVALYARLLGKYGDEKAIDVLKSYAEDNELNYNEFMEIRNAVEQLGGYFDQDENSYEDDEFYRFIKGSDEEDDESRRSPFEALFADSQGEEDDSELLFDQSDEGDCEECEGHGEGCDCDACQTHKHERKCNCDDCGDDGHGCGCSHKK